MHTLHFERDGPFTLTLHHDETPESPREWDNLGTMTCWHRRYTLGDRHDFSGVADWLASLFDTDRLERKARHRGYGDSIAFVEDNQTCLLDEVAKTHLVLPVYLYDHSGLALRCFPFNCPWDSGQVGFIHVSHARLRQEYGVRRVSRRLCQEAKFVLEDEVKTFSQWVNGEVYGYQIENSAGDIIDGCWGFYGKEAALYVGRKSLSVCKKGGQS